MTDNEFAKELMLFIDDFPGEPYFMTVGGTFKECGVLTKNAGFEVTAEDGSVFQVTITKKH